MVTLGYALSSEEHPAQDLVRFAKRAEEVGFEYASISDHFHPWIDRQGESTFVFSVVGAISNATKRLRIMTGVTCPIVRYHPAIVAHAASTLETLMPGRFMLGVGTGESLNEHIIGQRWPEYEVRAEMLEEAVEVIRKLWSGGVQSHHGKHYTLENARIYSLPERPPPIIVAAGGPRSAAMAGRIGDGLIDFAPEEKVVAAFDDNGGAGKPKFIQFNVCWAEDEAEARKTALEICPTVALSGALGQELPNPWDYEAAVEPITEEKIAEVVVCGPDPSRHIEGIQKCIDAGFDHVHVDQIGPDQDGFFAFYEREIIPKFA
jgi:coenzyme F420-dependent glucose-6-phosphate dehydrogenase